MNVYHKISFVSLVNTAVFSLVLAVLILNSVQAAPCFDNPQRAYDYLLAQESAKTQARDQATVNINRASEGELVSLNGIGSSKAQAIILYREMFGSFKTVDELAKVKGIGAKTVEKNRGRLRVQD
ncbi:MULTISPECIES: ComEA family DNA-binding protein [unclassified Psychrobacter]|uniref:ComEA family DNA-binding protein n=1 Tax=unclassified Psychrobacter TaxID=196806 RepID=UPI000ED5CF63|nr:MULTISPECIES: ComEA family DNA-binding protein [unclassified Psychrobacter]HCI76007.1 competence protein ComEA [Psychrobacter sp.]